MHDRAGLGTRESRPYAGPDNERYAGLMLPVKPGPGPGGAPGLRGRASAADIARPTGHTAARPCHLRIVTPADPPRSSRYLP